MDLRHTAGLMLTVGALLVSVHSQAVCSPEWFGSWCQYKCRCSDNNCTREGNCGHGVPCERGWFGPACQYVDLAYSKSSARETTDGDDKTCLAHSAHVTITLDNRYLVTWLRVRLSKPGLLYNLTVRFRQDASLSCTNTRTARVDNTTLDIHCDLKERVQHVVLSGEGVQHLCSVYVSGGRNVALKQHSSQSSTYWEDNKPGLYRRRGYPSQYAVDGNSDSGFYEGNTCSHTLPVDPNPNLNISFSKLQRVTRYVLYNRGDEFSVRLIGFELRSFGPSMTPVFNYRDRSRHPQQVYTVVPDQVTPPIRLVNVAVSNSARMLTLCELEVYGDSACQSGQYGMDCEHTCHCAGGQSCFVSTGRCPSGCAAGFLGQDCGTGCDVGSYGPGCQLSCSQFCVRDRDPRAHFCDNTNGTCLHGCQSGYQDPKCSERCDPGSYGPRCQSSCSQFCARDNDRKQHFCDNVNGTCLHGCKSGYLGSTCAEKLPMDVAVVAAPVVAGVGVLVLVVVAVVLWRRRKTTKSETHGGSPTKSKDISLSRNDYNEVHQPLSDDGHAIPGVSTAVTQRAALMGSQGKIKSEDMFGYDCVVQSCDDSVDQLYENIGDNLASPYEAVVDDSNKDISPTQLS